MWTTARTSKSGGVFVSGTIAAGTLTGQPSEPWLETCGGMASTEPALLSPTVCLHAHHSLDEIYSSVK